MRPFGRFGSPSLTNGWTLRKPSACVLRANGPKVIRCVGHPSDGAWRAAPGKSRVSGGGSQVAARHRGDRLPLPTRRDDRGRARRFRRRQTARGDLSSGRPAGEAKGATLTSSAAQTCERHSDLTVRSVSPDAARSLAWIRRSSSRGRKMHEGLGSRPASEPAPRLQEGPSREGIEEMPPSRSSFIRGRMRA